MGTGRKLLAEHAGDGVVPRADPRPSRLLVVGLDPSRRMRFEYRLLEAGLALRAVTFAENLSDARSALHRVAPECILVDLGLPEPSGVHAVTVLSAAAPEVPIVVVTAPGANPDLVYEALTAGAVDHIVDDSWQPVPLRDVLARAVRRHEDVHLTSDPKAALASVLDTVDGPACVLDGGGRIVAVNAAWTGSARDGGAEPQSCGVGVNYLSVCERAVGQFADGAIAAADGLRAVLDGKLPSFVFEYPCPTKEEERWFTLRAVPFGSRGGGAVVAHRDITDLKRAERRLQIGSEWVHRMLDEDYPVFALVSAEGTIVHVSDSTLQLLGRSESTVGLSTFFSVEPHDRDLAMATFARVAAEPGERERLLVHVIDGSGRVRELDLEIRNRLDDPLIGAVTVAGTDVTESRRHQITRHLESRLLERLPAAVVVSDERDVVVYWNAEAARTYGRDAQSALGRPLGELGIWPQDVFDPDTGAVSVPDGRWEGEHDVRLDDGTSVPLRVMLERLDDDEIEFHGVVAASVDITERRELEADLAFRSLHDPLTGLPNRRLFVDHLQRALSRDAANGRYTAVFFADLDDFGPVNEEFGRAHGDALLRAVAARLASAVRPGDAVARLGGDEFVVCCDDLDEHAEAATLAERIRHALARPVDDDDDPPPVPVSIGVAVSDADSQAEGLLRNADIAMYHAKEKGKGRVEMFDDEHHRRAREQFEMAADLDRAVEIGNIDVVYQPLYVLATGELYGFEALARWTHPEWGAVEPADFIRAAELSGSIGALGETVLTTACRALASWRRRSPERDVSVTVNVSALQLADPGFPEAVRRVVEQAGVPPESVCLEVTESALAETDVAAAALETLKALGVRTSIDDFGTEYSSLSRLHRFPIDYLKIDKAFVAGIMERPVDAAIVHALLGLAHSLGIRAVAEGVEDETQLEVLLAAGCDLGQGYYWSKPVPPEDAAALVS